MRWFAALLTQPRRFFMVFVAGELLLAMAIPFMIIEGYHTLLDSRAGKFVEEPTRLDPGWRALVDPTEVVGIAEVDRGVVTGVTLLVNQIEVQSAGSAILVPGTLQVDGLPVSARSNPADAVAAVGQALHLAITRVEVLDTAGWTEVLGATEYTLESPDPVLDDAGNQLFAVGPVVVNGSNAAAFAGRPAPGAPTVSVKFRRQTLWNAIVAAPPSGSAPIAADLRALDATASQVIDLPTEQIDEVTVLSPAAAESLIRDVVAYPAGHVPGDRLQVRILDRTGTADLEDIAAAVAAQGIEVIEIGNAAQFDGGTTEFIALIDLVEQDGSLPPTVVALMQSAGTFAATVDAASTDSVVTVVIGQDFDLANLY
ncbi:MAG: hypothetical protein AAGA65_21660 [Actinomycetota bacterium]